MNNVSEMLSDQLGKFGVKLVELPHYSWVPAAVLIVTAIIGLIYCLYGYKAMRFLAMLMGIAVGAAAGAAVVNAAKLTAPVDLIFTIAAAAVFGVLGYFLYRIGVFIVVFLAGFGVAGELLVEYTKLDEIVVLIISLVIGVILAVLAVVYLRPIVILTTGLTGGLAVANVLFENVIKVRWSPEIEALARIGAGLILALIGIIYQFRTTRRKD